MTKLINVIGGTLQSSLENLLPDNNNFKNIFGYCELFYEKKIGKYWYEFFSEEEEEKKEEKNKEKTKRN